MLTHADADRLLAPLAGLRKVVLAVSGGPDSLALLLLVADWARRAPHAPALFAASVDHGLRAGSRAECDAAGALARSLGVPHAVLSWTGDKPRAAIQEKARTARYALLADLARDFGAEALVTAHHADDQVETVLMRLSRGSGIAGLAGMRVRASAAGMTLLRPLLGVRKADLEEICRSRGVAFALDPSNGDARFARARWRAIAQAFETEGLPAEGWLRLAERAARAHDALEALSREEGERLGADRDGEALVLSSRDLFARPLEIALRVLARRIADVTGEGDGPIRLDRLEAAARRLAESTEKGVVARLTLGGALLRLSRAGELRISPEKDRRRGRNAPGTRELVHTIARKATLPEASAVAVPLAPGLGDLRLPSRRSRRGVPELAPAQSPAGSRAGSK